MKSSIFLIEWIIFCYVPIIQVGHCQSKTLVSVHAIFRHGDRTPEKSIIYPTDPYKNKTYFPIGLAALTNEGKQREYKLGKFLRKKYNNFLGNLYIPEQLYARSSDYDRTKMSLLLVLAALFPPKDPEIWNTDLKWQPIPYNYEPKESDRIMASFSSDPKFDEYLNEELKSEKVQKIEKKYSKTLDYISKYSGWNPASIEKAAFLYFTLKSEKECGLQLPQWTQEIYPNPLKKFGAIYFSLISGSTKLKQLGGGSLFRKIVQDTQARINGTSNTKLFLYSGHDYNVAVVLNTLNIFKPHNPPYGSCVLIEIHYINGQYGVKIFYENYELIQTGLLKIPGCEEFCPLDKFISLVEKYYPNPNKE